MPELAEVEYFKRVWEPAVGARITGVHALLYKRIFREIDNDAFPKCLIGTHLINAFRRGKQLAFVFDSNHWLGLHMGMTGKLILSESPTETFKYDYLTLFIEGDRRLIFQDPRLFGKVLYTFSSSLPQWWKKLPEELTSPSFTFERMNTYLTKRARSPIKSVLLDQMAFPGIGNWMADEILWRSRIAPMATVQTIGEPERKVLFDTVKEVCRDALDVIADGWKTPPDTWLFNHRWRDNGICPKTSQPLIREKIGGRTACWSPAWQIH